MSSSPAIEVHKVGKSYMLGAAAEQTLVDRLGQAFRGARRRPAEPPFWALRDVDLRIEQGAVLGLVGRNGAGKSTLLKLLSRITRPTEGRVVIRGRVGSLLEVGTGFHPELTGRENIYLNGAILGMKRAEIAQRFDEIVDFSGISRFIDTPVKRYSSGMYVRLAFAVAAHLEPEVLLVDEVLAVGDAEFQRRCLGKLREVAGGGRTVVLVSHNMAAIRRLCDEACWIDGGRLRDLGPSSTVVDAYIRDTEGGIGDGTVYLDEIDDRITSDQARLRAVSLLDWETRTPTSTVHLDDPLLIECEFDVTDELEEAAIELGICTRDGERVATAQSIDHERPPERLPAGSYRVHVRVEPSLLPGDFTLDLGLHHLTGHTADYVSRALGFTVLNASRSSNDHWRWGDVRGYVRPPSRWTIQTVPAGGADSSDSDEGSRSG